MGDDDPRTHRWWYPVVAAALFSGLLSALLGAGSGYQAFRLAFEQRVTNVEARGAVHDAEIASLRVASSEHATRTELRALENISEARTLRSEQRIDDRLGKLDDRLDRILSILTRGKN
jgi:hypothetical protein